MHQRYGTTTNLSRYAFLHGRVWFANALLGLSRAERLLIGLILPRACLEEVVGIVLFP